MIDFAYNEPVGTKDESAYHFSAERADAAQELGEVDVRDIRSAINFDTIVPSSADRPNVVIDADQEPTLWTPYLESRFQHYVSLRAEGRLSRADRSSLDRLRHHRERLNNPIPTDVILRDFHLSELRAKAMEAVQEYVRYLEKTTNRAKA